MLRNYLKVALRTLIKNRAYTTINVIGLAIGISGATLLLTYVKSERTYDKFHINYEHIVRPIVIRTDLEEPRYYASNPMIMAQTLEDELPEVVASTTLSRVIGQFNMNIDGQRFTESEHYITESDVFAVFDFSLEQGDESTALSEPFCAVLTESEAMKLFGTLDVLGKTINNPGVGDFKVTGLMKDPPANSHLQFKLLVSEHYTNNRWQRHKTAWTGINSSSYLVLAPGTDLEVLRSKTLDIIEDRAPEGMLEVMDLEFQAMPDFHFGSNGYERDIAAFRGNNTYMVVFVFLAIFLLIIASVNYMNLATAKALFRAKEIGVRKVVGAVRNQLVAQFLVEAVVVALLALIISVGFTDLIMPYFNDITERSFEFSWYTLPDFSGLLVSITLVVGLLSGIYPALFMTRLKPVTVLKGSKVQSNGFSMRKALVVFQFVLSTVLIIATLVASQQINYISQKNLGFEKENLLVLDINDGRIRPVFESMRHELEQVPGVISVSASSRIPGEWKNIHEAGISHYDDNSRKLDSIATYYMGFDKNMLSTFGFRLKEGSAFTGNNKTDSTKILLNEAAVEALGLTDPVGKTLQLTRRGTAGYQVIGVLENFHFQSLHTAVQPMVVGHWNNPSASIDYFTLRFTGNGLDLIDQVQRVHNEFDQLTVMEYHFLDTELERFYRTESQAGIIFKIGAGLSIIVACLGLLGLASFTVQNRIKELGIRKVLGASEWRIFYLLSSAFAKQVLLAFVIACPIGYYLMSNWLTNFQFRIELGVQAFIIAGFGTLIIALLTVSYRALKAANTNPINSLRSE